MAKEFAISVKLEAIDRVTKIVDKVTVGVIRSLRRIEEASEQITTGVRKALSFPGAGLVAGAAAALSYDKLSESIRDCTGAAKADHAALRQLNILVSNAPGGSLKAAKSLSEYAEQIERTYKVNHKATEAMESQLATYRLTPDLIKRSIVPLMQYAEHSFGVSMSSDQATEAAMKFGRAIIGGPAALRKMGIALDSHTQKLWKTAGLSAHVGIAVSKLNSIYKGLAAAKATSGAGEDQDAENRIERIKSRIGDAFLPLEKKMRQIRLNVLQAFEPAVKPLIKNLVKITGAIGDTLQATVQWAKENPKAAETVFKVVGAVTAFVALVGPVGAVSRAILGAIGAVRTLIETMQAVGAAFAVGGIAEGIAAAFAAWPILAVAGAIAAVVAIGYLVYKNWDKIKATGASLWKSVSEGWKRMKLSVDHFVNSVRDGWNKFVKFIRGNSPFAIILKVIGTVIAVAAVLAVAFSPVGGAIAAVVGIGLVLAGVALIIKSK